MKLVAKMKGGIVLGNKISRWSDYSRKESFEMMLIKYNCLVAEMKGKLFLVTKLAGGQIVLERSLLNWH